MRLVQNSLEFEGTTEEYKEVRPLFERIKTSSTPIIQTDVTPRSVDAVAEEKETRLTPDEIAKVLKRRPLMEKDNNHRKLFNILEEYKGDFLSASVIMEKLGFHDDRARLAGVLGSLGRRINQTPDISRAQPPQTALELFIDVKKIDNEWHYRIRPELSNVLKDIGFIN